MGSGEERMVSCWMKGTNKPRHRLLLNTCARWGLAASWMVAVAVGEQGLLCNFFIFLMLVFYKIYRG